MDYPKPLKHEFGCKVTWRTYSTETEAHKAAKIAAEDSEIDKSMGYDFGFLEPSTITKNDDGTYTVVCP